MAKSYYSTVFDAPADKVWAAARDFNGLATWFPSAIGRSEIEGGKSGEAVGGIRNFMFGDTNVRERLLAMSDVDRSYTYCFEEPVPFPVRNYESTIRVTPVTDGGKAFVEWWTTFDCAADEYDQWTAFFAAEVFEPALESLRQHLGA